MSISNGKRRECSDSALQCFGTAYIFEKKAKSIRQKIRFFSFLGIAGPASVGAIIGSFSLKSEHIQIILTIAAIIAVIQLIFSVWSIVTNWNENQLYFLESKSSNYRLAETYDRLAKATDLSENKFNVQFASIEAEGKIRTDLDNRIDISDKEKRRGMRAGLRQYQRKCAGCQEIPKSMKPSNCEICGNF